MGPQLPVTAASVVRLSLMVNSEDGDGVVSVAVARDVAGVSKGDRQLTICRVQVPDGPTDLRLLAE
jgi:hypothetical protein